MGRRGTQIVLASGILVVLAAGAGYVFLRAPAPEPVADHYASHAQRDFYPTLQAGAEVPQVDGPVAGAIVSHHLYAEADIAKLFLAMRDSPPSTVVIIGPNHFSAGNHDILVSRAAYDTPWGRLENDSEITRQLIEDAGAFNEESAFEREHSISALVTFVKYAFPDTPFVPVILKRATTMQDARRLAEVLDDILPDDALVLASVDFSHHGNRFMAQFHDDKSVAAIQSFDMEAIPNLEIDSPPSVFALLNYLQLRGAQRMTHRTTNSAVIGANPASEDVTSYLFAHFSDGPVTADPAVSSLHFGDVMLDRAVAERIRQGINPFARIRGVEGNFFRGTDAIAVNLEGPITDGSDCGGTPVSFRFPPSSAQLLRRNGITLANVANNHAADCGAQGMADTRRYLQEAGVGFFGGSDTLTRAIAGRRVAFVGPDRSAIAAARASHDHVIVHAHWGVEYQKIPDPTQRRFGHELIDAGADVVIGHHPHVVQPVEIYHGGAIFYSLGNFVFDQTGPGTTEGIGVGVIRRDDATRFTIFPFDIVGGQPVLKRYDDAVSVCNAVLKDIPDRDGCVFEIEAR